MTGLLADITIGLDGFVTGSNADPGGALQRTLHEWLFDGDEVDEAVLVATTDRSGGW